MQLSPKKNGKGYVTSYSLNIGSAEAREAGFIDTDGKSVELVKEIDAKNKTITIRLKQEAE